MTFKAVFDSGIPTEEVFSDENELEIGLREFYNTNKDSDYPFDTKVYNEEGEDISESQFITDIINNILGDN
jgi:hypothetical protein